MNTLEYKIDGFPHVVCFSVMEIMGCRKLSTVLIRPWFSPATGIFSTRISTLEEVDI